MEALADQYLDLPEGYDSNEEEDLLDAEPVVYKQGMKQMKLIFDNALENRASSKRTLKNHRPTSSSPATQDQRQRWYNLFMAFSKTLGLPANAKPHADHIYRFTDVVARTVIKSGIKNKALPSLYSLKTGLQSLVAMLVEMHGFTATRQDSKRIESLLNQLVKDKVLFKGKWRKPNRAGFQTVLYMTNTWMQSGLQEGVRSWDTHISRQLSIVLIGSFGSRCGEVVRSKLYTGMEYLCYKDLSVLFHDGEETQDLAMNVSLRFVKGYKDLEREDRNIRVDALSSSAYNAACAVKMLLIHALRVGAVNAKSWSELKANTLRRADKTVQWATPDHPVIAAMNGGSAFLILDKAATVQQPLRNINALATKARFVNHFRVHDLRHGAMSDLAHLQNQSQIRGHASMAIAASVGHKMSTFMSDTSEGYVGGSDVSTWGMRADSTWKDSRAPKITQVPYIPKPFAPGEVSDYCKSMNWDPKDSKQLTRARHNLRNREKEEWQKLGGLDASPAVNTPTFAAPSTVLPTAAAAKPTRAALQPKNSNVQMARTSSANDTIDPILLALSPGKVLSQSVDTTLSSLGVLDQPQLDAVEDDPLESDDALNEEDAERAEHMMGLIIGTSSESSTSENQSSSELALEEERELLDALEDVEHATEPATHDPIHVDADEFIKYFSSINVIKHTTLWAFSETRFNETVERYIPTGNSRDWPTRFVMSCPNKIYGCTYISAYGLGVSRHHYICTITSTPPASTSTIATVVFKCRKEDCEEQFHTRDGRNSHERAHDWTSKQCDLGCTDGAWYVNPGQWKRHKQRHHEDRWDPETVCTYKDCTRKEPFATSLLLTNHIRWVHEQSLDDAKEYVPKKAALPVWGKKRLCPYNDCIHHAEDANGFINIHGMMRHLTGKRRGCHNMSTDRATAVCEAIKMGTSLAGLLDAVET